MKVLVQHLFAISSGIFIWKMMMSGEVITMEAIDIDRGYVYCLL